MTQEIKRDKLAEYVARRIVSDMEDHGSLEDFCEAFLGFPEKYALELAYSAIDCIGLSECLHPRVQS